LGIRKDPGSEVGGGRRGGGSLVGSLMRSCTWDEEKRGGGCEEGRSGESEREKEKEREET